VFVAKGCEEAFNVYFTHLLLKKLQMGVPEIRLLQRGEYEYACFQSAIERATRLNEYTRSMV
jgi:hypothetical protein